MFRIIRVWHEVDSTVSLMVLFESGLIIYQCDDDFSIFGEIRLSYEHEITIFYSFLIHRVSLGSEEEIFVTRREELGRYRYLGLDVLLGEDGHPTGDSTDERDSPDLIAIGRILWGYLKILK